MTMIPPFFLNAVVALGIEDQQQKKPCWIGTGFLVGRKVESNPELSTIFLISNKHVFCKEKMFVKFNSKSATKDYELKLSIDGNSAYSKHPNPQADVAAMWLNAGFLNRDGSNFDFFNLDDHSLTLSRMKETGVCEGSFVYALGFPMNLVESIKNTPICRLGCISRISHAFEKKEVINYLVDAQAFPGNSGGPIISMPETVSINGTPNNSSSNLIGILHSNIQYQDTLISQQTGERRSIQSENSGLTLVHPVDLIKEVVELEYKRISTVKK